MSDKLVPINRGEKQKPYAIGKKVGIAARKEAAALNPKKEVKIDEIDTPPEQATHRIGIVFDDSSSMYGSSITDAHEGTEEFIRNCDPKNTAITVYPMNANRGSKQYPLTRKLYTVAMGIKGYQATGSTPLYETLELMLRAEKLTRGILFSDGEPNGNDVTKYKESSIITAIEQKVPVDTVYIGRRSDEKAVSVMREIAERTGGVFLIFEPGKANFRTAFKYLSPGYRAMLADKSFVAKVESGEYK
jgi:Mg-chelatase subunit ChlD